MIGLFLREQTLILVFIAHECLMSQIPCVVLCRVKEAIDKSQ